MTDQAIIEQIERRRAVHLLNKGDDESRIRAEECERILAIINRVLTVDAVATVWRIKQQREAEHACGN